MEKHITSFKVNKMKITYELPATDLTNKKRAFLNSLTDKFPKMVQWLLTVFEKEGLDFREDPLNKVRSRVKELCYPTKERTPKYNCKGAVQFPHSHYYDTAITEAVQKWNSFLTWKEKSGSDKRFPDIESYAPVFDSFMFKLDLESEWITLKTSWGQESVHIPITVPNKSHYDNIDKDEISSINFKKKDDSFVFLLTQKLSSPKKPSPSELGEHPIVGVDLGERNLASSVAVRLGSQRAEIVDVEFFRGSEAKELEHREQQIHSNLQEKGKSGEIPKRSWKSSNKKKDMCEKIACKIKEIAEEISAKAVFIGDLKAPRPGNFGALSRRLNNYPFAKLKEAMKRHLRKAGIFVKLVYEGRTKDDLGTSQKCHKCGSEGERYKGGFSCPSCRLESYNADLNAAVNIAERGIKSLGIPEGLGAVP